MSRTLQLRVAEQLEHLNAPGQELHVQSRRSTWMMYGDTVERLRVWEELIEQFRDEQPTVSMNGSLIVLTAGPPGAGKSTAVEARSTDFADCRRIDPDRIKELLIQRAVEERIYEPLLQRPLHDGMPIMPMELSGLVHEESVRIADEVRLRSLRAGENILMEGTMNWDGLLDRYVRDLTRFDYERLSIISVEVPIEVAIARGLDRWWIARSDSANLLGGRFVPRAAVAACYLDDGRTRGRANAEELARRATRAGIAVDLDLSSDPGHGGARSESIASSGAESGEAALTQERPQG